MRSLRVETHKVLLRRARPGFGPGTSRTRSENHTPRPTSPERAAGLSLNQSVGPQISDQHHDQHHDPDL